MRKGIGLRNIKTAIAVFICLLIYIVLILILKAFNVVSHTDTNTYDGWAASIRIATECYTPFFACIATAYSMASTKEGAYHQAKLRIIASLIGGLFGVLIVFLYTCISRQDWSFEFISATGNPTGGFSTSDFNAKYILSFIIPIILTALSTVVVIYLCNLFNQKEAAFAAVLTLTAVMTSLGTNAIIYGFNRIFSTIIGVLVALGVNAFTIPHKYKNKHLLFCIEIDGIVGTDNEKLPGFPNYKFNSLTHRGCNYMLMTTRIPNTFMEMLKGVNLSHPILCMSGAALYDTKEKKYISTELIDLDVSNKIDEYFKNISINPFKNYIINDVQHIFTNNIDSVGEKRYYNKRKNGAYCQITIGEYPGNLQPLYYLVIVENDKVDEINKYINTNFSDYVITQVYEVSDEFDGVNNLKRLKIYSKEILNLNLLRKYVITNGFTLVGATTNDQADYLLNNSMIKLSSIKYNESFLYKNKYDKLLVNITKMYYSKKESRK